ncbi:MAG: hypothetical protein M3Z04_20390 [Chloroflexota bacterium]|nr:hypothetical protein [Chloroflexota bacterium]
MRYNSLDHFLTAQHAAIVTAMVAAQQAAGGHYAALTPAALQQNAANDVAEVLHNIRQLLLDSTIIQGFQAGAQENVADGVDLSDLIRMDQAFERGFCALVEQELRDQPDLAAELIRRIHYLTGRFRNSVTGVKVDQTLNRLRKKVN